MLIKTILFKNNLIKKIKSKNILKTKEKFWELKKDYKEKKIPLLASFEKNYKLSYSKKLVKVLRKKKNIILVGMGGSILGAKALYLFLKRKIKKKFFFLDNLSEKNILELNQFEKRIQNNLVNPGFSLYDDRFRIPLLFAGLGLESKIIDQQIRSVDIFPSIFDIIEASSKMDVDGSSVVPLIKGQSFEEKPAFIQIITNWLTTKSVSDINLIGIRHKGFKYFRAKNDPGQNVGLFDLTKDPHEVNNLAELYPEKITQMEKIISEIRKDIADKLQNKSEDQNNSKKSAFNEEKLKK